MDEDKGEIRVGIKDMAKYMCHYLGAPKGLFWLMRKGGPKLLIFTYHKICPSSESHGYLAVPMDVFEQHVKFIKDNFKTVSLLDGLDRLQRGDSNEIYATINLDDGYMNNYLYAYPVLKKYGVQATIFLATDYIGKEHVFWWDRVFNIVYLARTDKITIDIGSKASIFKLNGAQDRRGVADAINRTLLTKDESGRWRIIEGLEKELSIIKGPRSYRMLSWDEIRKMDENLISFGAHTKTHKDLRMLDDTEVRRELKDSKKIMEEKLGKEIVEFCYPFGMLDKRVRALVEEAGFKCARTTLAGFNSKDTDPFLLTWIAVGSLSDTSFLAARISSNLLKCFWRRIR